MNLPHLALVWDAEIDIGDRQDLGAGPDGHRFLVPILGGSFSGPRLRGTVLPGGADRQRLRPDGVRELSAQYEMQVDDGTLLTVRNRVLVDDAAPGGRYARSSVEVRVAQGPHGWLNRRVLVGTLESLKPQRQAVRVSVFEVS